MKQAGYKSIHLEPHVQSATDTLKKSILKNHVSSIQELCGTILEATTTQDGLAVGRKRMIEGRIQADLVTIRPSVKRAGSRIELRVELGRAELVDSE